MVHSLLNYSFRRLLDAKSLSFDIVIYDLPVVTSHGTQMTEAPFSLTEGQAGDMLQKIVSTDILMEKLRIKLNEAQRLPRPAIIAGAHPVDENLIEIKKIVRSVVPNAPTDVILWFAGLAYEMVNSNFSN